MFQKLRNKFIKKLPYPDRFILRLPSSTIGCGMLHEGNPYLMDYAIKNMPESDYVLEIGCWGGLSTNLLLHLMKKYGRKEQLLGCDPWMYGYEDTEEGPAFTIDGRDDVSRAEYMTYIKNGFIASVRLFHKTNLPNTFQLKSDDFFEHFDQKMPLTDVFGRTTSLKGQISFAYIDGNHTYEFVKRDFENVSRHLAPNGIILFDDSFDGAGFGSSLFMKEIKQQSEFKIIGKNPNYLIQKTGP